jgi:hypothetical protein
LTVFLALVVGCSILMAAEQKLRKAVWGRKKLFDGIAVVMVVSVCSPFLWLRCSACNNYVSEEDYARMAQEIVVQSISQDTESSIER